MQRRNYRLLGINAHGQEREIEVRATNWPHALRTSLAEHADLSRVMTIERHRHLDRPGAQPPPAIPTKKLESGVSVRMRRGGPPTGITEAIKDALPQMPREFKAAEIKPQLREPYNRTPNGIVAAILCKMVTGGVLTRERRGYFIRRTGDKQTITSREPTPKAPSAPETPAPPPPITPSPIAALSGSAGLPELPSAASLADDARTIDNALAALGELEAMVRRHQDILRLYEKLAALLHPSQRPVAA